MEVAAPVIGRSARLRVSLFRGTGSARLRPIRGEVTADRSTWLPLGELLVERRLLSQRQLELALQEHARTGRRLGEVLVAFGFVSEQALATTLLEQVGLMDAKAEEEPEPEVVPEPLPEPEPAPALRTVGHLEEAEPEPERADRRPGRGSRPAARDPESGRDARGAGRRLRAAQRGDPGEHRPDPRRPRRAAGLAS